MKMFPRQTALIVRVSSSASFMMEGRQGGGEPTATGAWARMKTIVIQELAERRDGRVTAAASLQLGGETRQSCSRLVRRQQPLTARILIVPPSGNLTLH